MPTEPLPFPRLRIAVLAAAACALTPSAQAQTDDTAPFYAGGTLGVSRVSNVYRQSSATNDDTVVSTGLLGGIDTRLGRQHLTLDASLQNNRYSTNKDLNYRSHSIRGALNWETVGDLSGVLSVKSDRSLADFNMGSGLAPDLVIREKNVETNDEYQAIARLGFAARYMVEGGWTHRKRNFTVPDYGRFVYDQDTGSIGLYATPAGNVRLGLVARHTKGNNPRYPIAYLGIDPATLQRVYLYSSNDYTRDDIDFTTRWNVAGHSTVTTRISRSKTKNSLDLLRDLSGTTGAVGWNWTPTAKLQLNVQYSRDTGQESVIRAAELNRVYTSWQLSGNYALTGKLSLSAMASSNRAARSSESGVAPADALDDTKAYNLSLRWTFSRGLSLSCQYDHVSRDNSVPAYVYSAGSYGCTGQAIFF